MAQVMPRMAAVDLSWTLVVLGVLLVTIGQLDLFFTVLQYHGHGFVSRLLYRGCWALARAACAPLPGTQRPRMLSTLGPIMVVASLVVWISLAVIGFALIYYPSFATNFSLQPGVEAGLLDAIYASGVALSTVGFGDVTPTTPVFQMLTVLESLLGFSILTLAISYILGIYQVVSLQGELGAAIRDRVGRGDDPVRLARSYLAGGTSAVETGLTALHRDLLRYHEGMLRYPIVYYFHTGHRFRSMPYVFGMIGGAAAALRWGIPRCHPLASSAALQALVGGLRRVTADISGRFRWTGDAPRIPRAGDPRDALLMERFERLERELRRATPTDCEADDHRRRFLAWRIFTDQVRSFVRSASSDLGYRGERFGREVPRAREAGRN